MQAAAAPVQVAAAVELEGPAVAVLLVLLVLRVAEQLAAVR